MTEIRIANLRRLFAADISEMESAPLARVCQTFGVPYLVVRAGSNAAQEAPNDDYLRLGPIAAEQAARFTLHLLTHLEEPSREA
jgi:nucleoside phosphorylase